MKKLLLLCIALLIARCTQQIAGTTNETSTGTKAMVAGILFEPDGKTPAKSASVSMRRKTSLADTGQSSKTQPFSTASVTTDRNGKFSIDTIDTGLYIIEGNDGSNNVVLIDSIKVKSPDSSQNLGADTLLPAGVIKGVIKLIEGGDPRKVFVLAFGLDRFALPDANGNFTFPTLAKGNYSLRFLPSLENYGVLDTTGVPVRSGDTMNLDTIVLPFKGIPSPKNLVVSYDTLKQTVFLSWGKTDSSLITGYNIYRSDNKQNFSRISQTPVPKTITFYYDSTIVVGSLYEYRLVSLNTSGNESPMGGTPGDTVRIIPSSQVITTFNWTVKNATAGMASINDTVKFRLNFQNPTRNISRVDWFLNRKDSVIRQSLESSLAGSDSMVFSWNKVGKNTVYVNVIDAGGTVWTDSQSISIIQDVPSVQIIGNDTTFATFKPIIYVIAGNPFSLHGRATQLFGFFVKWEWKIGSGDWKTTNGMDTTLIAPSSEQAMPCSLAVTDDDGNRGICGIQVNMTLGVTKISSGAGFSLILKSDSSLWACGENNSGQLGVGDTVNRNVPVKVMSGVENMSAGGSHSLILKTDGSLWACGANKSGQLGDGTLTNRLLPVQIMSGGVQSMVASRGMLTQYSFILKTDGSLWACGNDQYGQLGDGGTGYYSVPVSIMPNVKSMDAGGFYGQTFIIKMDYTLWACGFNYGALGNVSYTNGSLPIQIMSSVQNVSTGEYNHSLFLKTDNTLWACGENEAGQFGDGTTTGSSVPVQAMNNVIGMSAGGGVPGFSLFLKADSTLWTSGNNASGVLGDGTKITPISPEKIMTNVKSMAAGYAHSLVLKTDGTLWGFGYNDYGALGDGTNTDRLIPIRIIPPQ